MADEIILNEDNFSQEVEKSPVPVLVDFWAPWCGPCRMLAPIIEEIASEYKGKAKVCKVNTDENPELASRFQISAIPTLILFKGGKVVKELVGLQSKEELQRILNEVL